MFNLVKYEFRKARNVLLTLIGITAVLQAGFQYALAADNEQLLVICVALLATCSFAVSLFVMVRGIAAYTNELKSRASYLTFLTPNSTLAIVASKFLYTFLNALFAFAVFIALFWLDFSQMMKYFGEYEAMIKFITAQMDNYGIHVQQILYFGLFAVLYAFLSLLSLVAIAYLAWTVSATLFRDKKWNWIPSLALFFGIYYGVQKLNGLFMAPLDQLEMIEFNAAGHAATVTVNVWQSIFAPALLPTALISLGMILISLFGCAYLLEKKVSL